MRKWCRASDRVALFGLPVVAAGAAGGSRSHSSDGLLSSAAVLTFSELADVRGTSTVQPVSRTSREEEVHDSDERTDANLPLSPLALSVVDVDALDEDNAAESTFATSFAMPSLVPAGQHSSLVRDAVVLSYRNNLDVSDLADRHGCTCDDARQPCMRVAVDLLAIAVDDSRVTLRRGGRVKRYADSEREASLAPLALHTWTTGSTKDDLIESEDAEARKTSPQERRTSASGQQYHFDPMIHKRSTLPIFSTRWKHETSVLLPEAQNQLRRVRPRGGAQSTIVFASHPGCSCTRCPNDFIALSNAAASLVHARDNGAELTRLQHVPFDQGSFVNATCMDDWGPHSTVVCFSDGTLRVVDWRVSDQAESCSTGVLSTRVPQPRWLGTRRRNALVFSSVAGVLSCCAMDDSFRVVCGLGDATGAVVVADLRRPEAPAARKRGRRSTADLLTDSLFSDVGAAHTPTGRAVTDISRNPQGFGQVGLVDVGGTAVLTCISVLEGTREASSDSVFVWQGGAAGAAPVSSLGSESSTNASRRRLRWPSPPPPWQVLARSERSATPITVNAVSSAHAALPHTVSETASRPQSIASGRPHPRCVFTSDGRHLVHTEAGDTMRAVLRRLPIVPYRCSGSAFSLGACETHQLQLSLSGAHRADRTPASSFVAVSSVDGLVCFDTGEGNTLSLLLN